MINSIFKTAAALALVSGATSAMAIVNTPVASNAYITIGSLDWAWASPCGAFGSCGDIDLTYQATQGWRLPTAAEFAVHPIASQFVFAGANVPNGGSDAFGNTFQAGSPGADGACATAYFSNFYTHCDWSDGVAGNWFDPSSPNVPYSVPETLLVRSAMVGGVPEPETWGLLIAGFGLVGTALRRRRTTSVTA